MHYLDAGWKVMFVTLTNGDAGHHEMERGALAQRRRRETERVAEIAGAFTASPVSLPLTQAKCRECLPFL